MQLSEIDNPDVHDLLQIDPSSVSNIAAPFWVEQALRSCPWVVVRRAKAPEGQIAVGVRGATRSERWGGFFKTCIVRKIVRPEELLNFWRSPDPVPQTPARKTLQNLIKSWHELTCPWGPIGSLGFELATGRRVTTELSDLDIVIRAPVRISAEQARFLWECAIDLQTKLDIRVETPECGFSLQEYARNSSGRILLRYPDGLSLGDDPWSQRSPKLAIAS